MSMKITRSFKGVANVMLVTALLAALLAPRHAAAGLTFNTSMSSVTFSHDAEGGAAPAVDATSTIPGIGIPFGFSGYQFVSGPINPVGTSGSSAAAGGLGRIETSSVALLVLSPGTFVDQIDPGPEFMAGSSSLRIDYDIWWNVTTGGFGPVVLGLVYVPLFVSGPGTAEFEMEAHWNAKLTPAGATLMNIRAPYTTDMVLPPGFSFAISTPAITNPFAIPAGGLLNMKGHMIFKADNEDGPTRFEFPATAGQEIQVGFMVQPVPAPPALVLVGLSLLAMAAKRRNRR